jgi:phosphatidylglycerophosphate synthase
MYLLKVGIVFTAIVSVAVGARRTAGAAALVWPADWVTTARAALVALLAGLVGDAAAGTFASAATGTAIVAASLDGVDGWLARRSGRANALGARFDMEVDALLILVLSILVWQLGKAGAWVLLSGLMRYAFVGAAAIWPWLADPLPPSRRRQTICVVQVVGLIVAVAPIVQPPASAAAAAVVLAALTYSFLVDILWLHQRAHR